jgi:hypothetical protein
MQQSPIQMQQSCVDATNIEWLQRSAGVIRDVQVASTTGVSFASQQKPVGNFSGSNCPSALSMAMRFHAHRRTPTFPSALLQDITLTNQHRVIGSSSNVQRISEWRCPSSSLHMLSSCCVSV